MQTENIRDIPFQWTKSSIIKSSDIFFVWFLLNSIKILYVTSFRSFIFFIFITLNFVLRRAFDIKFVFEHKSRQVNKEKNKLSISLTVNQYYVVNKRERQ